MSAILKFDFRKREQLRFSEENHLNYTKRPNFACGNYIFPKTRGNKNKPWTHSTPLKITQGSELSFLLFMHAFSVWASCLLYYIYLQGVLWGDHIIQDNANVIL